MTVRLRHVVYVVTMLGAIWLFQRMGLLEMIDGVLRDPIPSVEIGR